MKSRILASLLAVAALGLGATAQAENDDSDPVRRQLDRWGVPYTPENVARFYAEQGQPMPPQYWDRSAYGPGTLPPHQVAVAPPGYIWTQVGAADWALVNQITGAIAQILRVR